MLTIVPFVLKCVVYGFKSNTSKLVHFMGTIFSSELIHILCSSENLRAAGWCCPPKKTEVLYIVTIFRLLFCAMIAAA